ncbi:hypothetical protein [Mesorhizobium cantuariense]|uniref:Uncharacterized protein n=1 Tax=Mesorhizobium cantuariense TaxID=1300275 RepID=A0ABV7MX81_9HYPH
MTFLYDYGDEWRFGTGQPQPNASYPQILSKIGKTPPQYPDIEDE